MGSIVAHTVSLPKDQQGTEQRQEFTGQDQGPVLMTVQDIEQIIVNHSHEAINDFKIEVDNLGNDLEAKLKLQEIFILKAVKDL